MTRSVTIVNTSNWEHEDVEVVEMQNGWPVHRAVLEPGDKMVGPPNSPNLVTTYLIRGLSKKEPVPFKDADGNQDWPRVEVHKPTPSEPQEKAA